MDLVDNPIKWTAGRAVTAADYSLGRDADGTNQLHFNVPTGAGLEFSINDVAEFKHTAGALAFQQATTMSTTTGDLTLSAPAGANTIIGDDVGLLRAGGASRVRIGSASGEAAQVQVQVAPLAETFTSGANVRRLENTAAIGGITIDGYTAANVTGASFDEPDITLASGGLVTTAATIRVTGAPTEGTNNYALWVDSGKTQLDGEVEIDGDLNHDGSNVGLYGVAPAAQAAKVNDPSGGAIVDAEARTAINSIIDALEGIGISASAWEGGEQWPRPITTKCWPTSTRCNGR